MEPTVQDRIGVGEVELGAALAEAAGFAPAKYAGFEELAHRIAKSAGRALSLGEGGEFGLSYSDAEAMGPDLVFSSGMEKNLNFALRLSPYSVPGILSIARPVFYAWLELALGGARNAETIYPDRDPTEFEVAVGQLLCRRFCDALFSAFRGISNITHAQIISPGPDEELGNWIRRDQQIALFYEADLGPVSGEMTVVLPIRLIDPLRGPAAAGKQETKVDEAIDHAWNEMLRATVETTRLDMVAVLGRKEISLGEMADLQVGQLIDLGKPTREPVVIEAADQPVFTAMLGRNSGRYMLKFERVMEGAVETSDGFPA